MKRVVLGLVSALGICVPAFAFTPEIDAVVRSYKPEKPIAAADLAALQQGAERWCYEQQDATCGWSDVYLSADGPNVTYQIGYLWDEDIETFITEQVIYEGDRVCDTGESYDETLVALRPDGTVILGRDLFALRAEFRDSLDLTIDCFDYVFVSASEPESTITLRQRMWTDGIIDPTGDDLVTLHFDADAATDLSHRW